MIYRHEGTDEKPRVGLKFGIWHCRLSDWRWTGRVGFGYTPKQAYEDWKTCPECVPVEQMGS